MADDFAGSQGLFSRLRQSASHLNSVFLSHLIQHHDAALDIVGDRRERLVELVGKGGGHLPQLVETSKPCQLPLHGLQSGRALLPLRQIPYEAGEVSLLCGPRLAHSERHWECRSIFASPHDDPINTDYALLAGCEVSADVAIVLLAVRRRHQHANVLADHLLCRTAALLKDVIVPSVSITTVASGTVSRID